MFSLSRFTTRYRSSSRTSLGFTLVELAIGLGVMGLLFAGVWRVIGNLSGQLGDQAIARQTKAIQQALVNYIAGERDTILSVIPTSGTCVEVPFMDTTPGGLNGLKPAAGYPVSYLPAAVAETNGLGQTYRLVVRNNNNRIEGYVVSAGGTGSTLPEHRMVQLAGMVGSDGGVVRPSTNTLVSGSYGGWSLAKSTLTGCPGWPAGLPLNAGDYVATTFYAQSIVTADYLYRNAVTGHPEVNQMNTNIDMNNKGLNNLSTVTSTDLTVTSNTITLKGSSSTKVAITGDMSLSGEEQAGSLKIGCIASDCSTSRASIAGIGDITGRNFVGQTGAFSTEAYSPVGRFLDAQISTLNVGGPTTGFGTANISGSTNIKGSFSIAPLTTALSAAVSINPGTSGTIDLYGNSHFYSQIQVDSISYLKDTYINGILSVNGTTYPSDRRLKTKISPIKDALNRLLMMRGVDFIWKQDHREDMGVIAQDVEKVFPALVREEKNGMKSVQYTSLIGPMIEAIRELKTKTDALEEKNKALEAEVKDLRAQLRQQKP